LTTTPCPHCGEQIAEDVARCPYCEHYTADEDSPRRGKPVWIWVALLVMFVLSVYMAFR
jgi:uncharacterized paraquat-inducible protein A